MVSQPKGPRFNPRNFIKIYIFDNFSQIFTVKDFNFQLFGVLRGPTLRFDGSHLLFLRFYSNLTGHDYTPANIIAGRNSMVSGSICDIYDDGVEMFHSTCLLACSL